MSAAAAFSIHILRSVQLPISLCDDDRRHDRRQDIRHRHGIQHAVQPEKERQERRIIRRDMRFVRKERRAVQTKKAADAIRSGRPIENVLRLKQRAGQPPVPRAGGGDAAADAVLPLCQKCGKCRRVDLPRRISSSIRILRFCMQIPHECGHRVACEQIK